MSSRLIVPLALALAFAVAGCGKPPANSPAPLTVADWRAMPAEKKYASESLERLKEGDPKLQSAEGWEEFSRTTLTQERRKDFPRGRR